MLWSDESMFELFPSRRVWVGRRKKRYHPDCINSAMKHGGGNYKFGVIWLLMGLEHRRW